MSPLKYAYLAYLSKPKQERRLYRLVKRHQVHNVVELGVGTCRRALNLIQVAQRYAGSDSISYTGIDLFDAHTDLQAHLPLKEAHRQLQKTKARIRLLPGDPYSALAACANNLTGSDLLLISADVDAEALSRAWFYVPRMLHADSVVLRETVAAGGEPGYEKISQIEIEQLAAEQTKRRTPKQVAGRRAA